jgi:hypothetical protein
MRGMAYLLDLWNKLSHQDRVEFSKIILDKDLLALVMAAFTLAASIIVERCKHFLVRRAALEATTIPRIYDLMKEIDSIYTKASTYFTDVLQVYDFYFEIAVKSYGKWQRPGISAPALVEDMMRGQLENGQT